MKKTVCFGLLAMVLAFGFIGCGGDDGDNPIIKTYQGTANGETYVLKINETDGTFELTVGGKTSTGAVSGSGNNLTLTPAGKEPFSVMVSSSGINAINGTITFNDGSSVAGPGTVTPGASNSGSGNQIIITGYPGDMEESNGRFWVSLHSVGTDYSDLSDSILAVAGNDPIETVWNFVSISGDTVTIRLMSPDQNWDAQKFTPWTGTGTFDVWVAPKGTRPGSKWYKSSNVSITSATTTLSANSFVFVIEQGPDPE